jgi:hypothetical protein
VRVGVGLMRLPSYSHKLAMPTAKVLQDERILTDQSFTSRKEMGCLEGGVSYDMGGRRNAPPYVQYSGILK